MLSATFKSIAKVNFVFNAALTTKAVLSTEQISQTGQYKISEYEQEMPD